MLFSERTVNETLKMKTIRCTSFQKKGTVVVLTPLCCCLWRILVSFTQAFILFQTNSYFCFRAKENSKAAGGL